MLVSKIVLFSFIAILKQMNSFLGKLILPLFYFQLESYLIFSEKASTTCLYDVRSWCSAVTDSPLMVVSRGTKNRAGNGRWNLAEIRRPTTKLTTLTLDRVV